MSWLTAADLMPYRGAWVKIDGENPKSWVAHDCPPHAKAAYEDLFGTARPGYSDFRPRSWEGLLGHKIRGLTEDVTSFSLNGNWDHGRLHHIEELWRPAKTAIRYICNLCAKTEEVGKKYCSPSQYFGKTTKACSLCGKTAKYDRILTPPLQGVIETDHSFWKYATREEAIEFLDSADFARRMTVTHGEYFLREVRVQAGKSAREFAAMYQMKDRHEILYVTLASPPSAIDWEQYWTLPQLKEFALVVRNQDFTIDYQKEPAT